MSRCKLYNKNISRLVAVLLVIMLLVGVAPAALADGESGSLGDNLNWSLSGGVLTITGSGEMADIPETDRAPWYELRNEIYQVVLPEGLTSIGNMAFYECQKLQMVDIPDSVTRIGNFAFAYCGDLEMLDLGSGVSSIGEAAFTDCDSLVTLRLPESLRILGKKAFYRCEALTAVTVPSGVTQLGVAVFGYCSSLVSVDIQAQVTELPSLLLYGCERLTSVKLPDSLQTVGYHTFLGCDMLNTVYYNGSLQTPEQIQQTIGLDVPEFETEGNVTEGSPGDSVTSGTVKDGEDGSVIYESTTVNQGEDATVSTQIQHTQPEGENPGNTQTEITVTITGDSGWQEATDAVNEALNTAKDIAESSGNTPATPHITVYVKDTDTIDQGFVDNLAGLDVTVTVVTQNGSVWQFKGSDLTAGGGSEDYDLRYEVTAGSTELCEELGTQRCFVLKFLVPATINAEILIRLDPALSLQNATLLQKDKELKQIQSSVVDYEGFAHFYLASVSEEMEYYVAINLPEAAQEAIIPEVVLTAYGSPEFVEPIQYEITGRTSSWGLNINQVTWILVGVMGSVVVIVGITMFALNKRRLKMGYVPDLDDEDE